MITANEYNSLVQSRSVREEDDFNTRRDLYAIFYGVSKRNVIGSNDALRFFERQIACNHTIKNYSHTPNVYT